MASFHALLIMFGLVAAQTDQLKPFEAPDDTQEVVGETETLYENGKWTVYKG